MEQGIAIIAGEGYTNIRGSSATTTWCKVTLIFYSVKSDELAQMTFAKHSAPNHILVQ